MDNLSGDLVILDSEGSVAGQIQSDMPLHGCYVGRQSFLKVSQATLSGYASDPAWDPQSERFICDTEIAASSPLMEDSKRQCRFDRDRYDWQVPWCLYNILMVEWQDGIVYRTGVGTIHIHAFDNASLEWRKILLG